MNRINHNKEDIDEQAKIHLDKVHNHLHNCLDGLPVHEPFVSTSEMLESGAIIMQVKILLSVLYRLKPKILQEDLQTTTL